VWMLHHRSSRTAETNSDASQDTSERLFITEPEKVEQQKQTWLPCETFPNVQILQHQSKSNSMKKSRDVCLLQYRSKSNTGKKSRDVPERLGAPTRSSRTAETNTAASQDISEHLITPVSEQVKQRKQTWLLETLPNVGIIQHSSKSNSVNTSRDVPGRRVIPTSDEPNSGNKCSCLSSSWTVLSNTRAVEQHKQVRRPLESFLNVSLLQYWNSQTVRNILGISKFPVDKRSCTSSNKHFANTGKTQKTAWIRSSNIPLARVAPEHR
jgi:hypothetical protein